jgi:carboxylesterase
VDDLEQAGWDDWVGVAEAAFRTLATACEQVVVAGLSMGGSLACRVVADHAEEVRGLVAVNPFIDPPAETFREALRALLADGIRRAPGIGGDAADPSAQEVGYRELPLAALLSLSEGLDDLLERLPRITCPILLLTSRVDHVVPTVSSDILAERVTGPVERVWLERSWHLATLDYQRDDVARRAVEFANKLCAV